MKFYNFNLFVAYLRETLIFLLYHTPQIEATEQKFAEEARKEEEEVLRLKEEIKKDEELAAKATNKAEKLKILKEERVRNASTCDKKINLNRESDNLFECYRKLLLGKRHLREKRKEQKNLKRYFLQRKNKKRRY